MSNKQKLEIAKLFIDKCVTVTAGGHTFSGALQYNDQGLIITSAPYRGSNQPVIHYVFWDQIAAISGEKPW